MFMSMFNVMIGIMGMVFFGNILMMNQSMMGMNMNIGMFVVGMGLIGIMGMGMFNIVMIFGIV